jgi:hypothetical protein
MYGAKAFLIFLGFLMVASVFLVGVFDLWKHRHRQKERLGVGGIVLTAFLLLWVFLISSGYIRKAHFHYELWRLSASDVTSIQIGRHDFEDQQTIEDLVGALCRNRWFEVNHGGWGDSVPMILRKHSGEAIIIDVALYFREPAAIIGPANPQGLGYSGAQAFAPEVPRAQERHGVKLPDCDTAHRKPCTQEQLDP